MSTNRRQHGFTLIELIIAIIIISISVAGVLKVMDFTTAHSADPMVQAQAVAVAESYLEEILSKSYNDPDGIDTETTRTTFDDVDDYDGLADTGAVNSLGVPVASLADYDVTVVVATEVVSGATMKRVDVTVTNAPDVSIQISGYSGDY